MFISKREKPNRFAFEGGVIERAEAKTANTNNQTIIMKKYVSRGIAAAAFAGMVLTLQAQDTTIDQSQFPTILQQPVDDCVAVGSPVTFSLVATNADSYQWFRNNVALDGQTNTSFTIASAGTNDVAYYSATAIKGSEAVPTRTATLNVYLTATPAPAPLLSANVSVRALSLNSMVSLSMGASPQFNLGDGGPIVVFGLPVTGGGGGGSCPGAYSGYVNYILPMSQGWGWVPDTNAIAISASDQNRSDTKVQAFGYYGDTYCAPTTANIPTPGPSPKYRFTIFFPRGSQVPTNSYPVTLTGFNQ